MNHEEHWSARYRSVGDAYLFGTAPCRFLRMNAEVFKDGREALSLADGEGRNSVWLAEQGWAVTATEISAVALEKARKLAHGKGVALNFECQDILAPQWPPSGWLAGFDLVLGIFVQFADPAGRERMFDGIHKVLRPGGLVALHGYTPRQLEFGTGGPSAIENLYTEALLTESFPGWEILRLQSYEAELSEGLAHHGPSALIDYIARKPA